MRRKLNAFGLILALLLGGCRSPLPISGTNDTPTPEAAAPALAFDSDQEAIDHFRQVTGVADLPLDNLGPNTMINSPHGDLLVTMYQDGKQGRYLVALQDHILVEYFGIVNTDEATPDALTDQDLSDRALQIALALVPDFDILKGKLEYSEGNKLGLHFYDWRSTNSTEWTTPPFVQVGLLRSGEVFAYSNTITTK